MMTYGTPMEQRQQRADECARVLDLRASLRFSDVLFTLGAEAMRDTQREVDVQAERFTESQRGKPARINPHDA